MFDDPERSCEAMRRKRASLLPPAVDAPGNRLDRPVVASRGPSGTSRACYRGAPRLTACLASIAPVCNLAVNEEPA